MGSKLVAAAVGISAVLLVSQMSNAAAPTEAVGRVESCTLDARSYCTVTHGLGAKPTSIVITPALPGQLASVDPSTFTDTTYRVRFLWHNGQVFAAGTVIRFNAHYDFTPVVTPTPSPTPTPTSTPTPSPSPTPTATPAGFSVRVEGNKLIDGSGKTLQLRGVNRSGTQYACQEGWGIFDGPSDQASVDAMASWGMNAVRVNGNEACALGINGVPAAYGGQNYINALKAYIAKLHAKGMYVILDLHHNGPGTAKSTDAYPMPDRDHSPAYWTVMANAFKDDPALIFDLYNEPWPGNGGNAVANWLCIRDGGSGVAGSGSPCAGQGFTYVAAGMQEMLTAVRNTGATNVVMVGGTNWAGYLDKWQTYKPTDLLNQLAASVHVYAPPLDSPYGNPSTWESSIGALAQSVPVVAGEGMDTNCTHTTSDQWLPWADQRGISYLFWAWVTSSCSDEPALIKDYSGTPTAYGAGLRDWLLNH